MKKYAVYLPTICVADYHPRQCSDSGDRCILDEPCSCRRDLCSTGRDCGALAALAGCQLEITNSIVSYEGKTFHEEDSCFGTVSNHVLHCVFDRVGIDAGFHFGRRRPCPRQHPANRRDGERSPDEQQPGGEDK